MRLILLTCIALLSSFAVPAHCDVVHMKDGRTMEGIVEDQGDHILLKMQFGSVRIQKSEIERIENREFNPPPPGSRETKNDDASPGEAAPDVELGAEHRNSTNGFAIRPPRRWKEIRSAKSVAASFAEPTQPPQAAKLDVMVFRTDEEVAEFAARFEQTYTKAFQSVRIERIEKTGDDPTKARQFIARFASDGSRLASFLHFARHEKHIFTLSFTCPESRLASLLPTILSSVSSLRFIPRESAWSEAEKKAWKELPDPQKRTVSELYDEAVSHYDNQEFPKAEEKLKSIIDIMPVHFYAHTMLAMIKLKNENLDGAMEQFKESEAIRPYDAEVHFNIAAIHVKQKEFDEAQTCLRKAIELEPAYAEAHANLGAVLAALDRIEEAIASFTKAIELDPDSTLAHYNLGEIYWQKGKADEACKEWEVVLEIDPEHEDARSALDRAREMMEKRKE